MNKAILLTAFALLLVGCAGRKAEPVAVMQPYDDKLSCDQIQTEIQANETKALQLSGENESAHGNNVTLGVVGAILFWPALFAIDTGDAEKVEMQALHDRNQHLSAVYTQLNCITAKSSNTAPAATTAIVPSQTSSPSNAAWGGVPAQKACKLADGTIAVKSEDDCKAAGGKSAPFE